MNSMLNTIPTEIWVQEISEYLDLKELVILRLVNKQFGELYQLMFFWNVRKENASFEEGKKTFVSERKKWKELRENLTEEEWELRDKEFKDEFWHGIGSEPWTGHTKIEETKGGSAKKLSDEDCFSYLLTCVLSYDCPHCNGEHQQMLRLALVCEVDVVPTGIGDSRDFNAIFARLVSRYYKNLYYQNRPRFGFQTLLESFSSLIEYILISNSLSEKKYDYATPLLYEIIGLYEKVRVGLSNEIRNMKEHCTDEERKKRFFDFLEILQPFYSFRRLLRMLLYYGADIYKTVKYNIHDGDSCVDVPVVLVEGVEENCIQRCLRMEDPYYFLFLISGGNFFHPNDQQNMGYLADLQEKDTIDFEKLVKEILRAAETPNMKLERPRYILAERRKFWKMSFLQKNCENLLSLFGKHCGIAHVFQIIKHRDRKFLRYLLSSEESCRHLRERMVRMRDGESMFTFACGMRGKMFRIIQLLIDKGWEVGHANKNGETGLMKCLKIRNIDSINVILNELANCRSRTLEGIFSGPARVFLVGDPWICWKLGIRFDEENKLQFVNVEKNEE